MNQINLENRRYYILQDKKKFKTNRKYAALPNDIQD
jgi:hypothetical protein